MCTGSPVWGTGRVAHNECMPKRTSMILFAITVIGVLASGWSATQGYSSWFFFFAFLVVAGWMMAVLDNE